MNALTPCPVQSDFLSALHRWQGKPMEQFPETAPPVGRIDMPDQDRMLANAFMLLCAEDSLTGRLAVIHRIIETQRRHREYERRAGYDTTATDALVDRLRDWQEALADTIGKDVA